jgi:site-specific DNA recombinase
MRAAIYARVSTGKQAQQDLSIPDQIAQCEAWCASKEWKVVKSFIDAGVSAMTDNRPQFQAMLTEAKSKAFDVILVHSQSRFARNTLDLLHHISKLEKAGVEFISITQDIGSGDQAKVMRTIVGAMDEYQSEETAKHVRRSMIENAKQGFWNGSMPPFGYEAYEAEKRGNRAKKKLRINTSEAEIVRLIFQLYNQGDGRTGPLGLKRIASYLSEKEICNRALKPFRIQMLQKILRNTAYIGKHYFNRRDSRKGTPRPENEWIAFPTDRIITDHTFFAAQEKLDRQHPMKTAPRSVSSNVLLTGLAHCAECGSPLRIQTGKNNQYRYYKCSKKADSGKHICKGCSYPEKKLNEAILTAILEKTLKAERVEKILSKLIERASSQQTVFIDRIHALRGEHTKLKAQIRRLYDTVSSGQIDLDATLTAHIKESQQRIELLVTQIASLEHSRQNAITTVSKRDLLKFSGAVRIRLLDGSNPGFARAYLRSLISKIEVANDQITITGSKIALASQACAFAGSGELVPTFAQEWRTRKDSNL